jgi:hypothetical protein
MILVVSRMTEKKYRPTRMVWYTDVRTFNNFSKSKEQSKLNYSNITVESRMTEKHSLHLFVYQYGTGIRVFGLSNSEKLGKIQTQNDITWAIKYTATENRKGKRSSKKFPRSCHNTDTCCSCESRSSGMLKLPALNQSTNSRQEGAWHYFSWIIKCMGGFSRHILRT